MRLIKRLGLILLIFTSVLCTWNCRSIIYGINQGIGQMKIVRNARPVEEVLADPNFPDSLKPKLRLIQEIKQFAFDSLGINESENYSSIYDQNGEPILWLVTASDKYELKPYEWRFPFLGKFSYKGYFDKEKAEKEKAKLDKKGYDTDIGTVNAWSTLGWFKDPVLSNMLQKPTGALARVIIHELTHGTLYIKNNVRYNENLATFVGDEGAKLFIKHKYGEDSKEMKDFVGNYADIERISKHVLNGAKKLDSLYISFEKRPLTDSIKDFEKYRLIGEIVQNADTISFYNPQKFDKKKRENFKPNNAFFISFLTYREELNAFEKEFQSAFNSDFKAYMKYLKETYPSL